MKTPLLALLGHGLGLVAAGLAAGTAAARPRVVLVSGEYEYSSMLTFPALREALSRDRGLDCVYLQRTAGEHIPGLEAIDRADLVIGMIRRMTLPPDELAHFQRYLAAGRPLIGLRTMCHAFENWKSFDHEVIGGNYHGHYRDATPMARVSASARTNPLLAGVPEMFPTAGVLYKTAPLVGDAGLLLQGQGDPGTAPEPLAWTHRYCGGRIFFSTLGHPGDFAQPAFMRLLMNAVDWALDRPADARWSMPAPLTGFPVQAADSALFRALVAARSFTILDLRPAAEFKRAHLKGAIQATDPKKLDPAAGYVLIGGSAETADQMHRSGFSVVYRFSGASAEVEKLGLPLDRTGG